MYHLDFCFLSKVIRYCLSIDPLKGKGLLKVLVNILNFIGNGQSHISAYALYSVMFKEIIVKYY